MALFRSFSVFISHLSVSLVSSTALATRANIDDWSHPVHWMMVSIRPSCKGQRASRPERAGVEHSNTGWLHVFVRMCPETPQFRLNAHQYGSAATPKPRESARGL